MRQNGSSYETLISEYPPSFFKGTYTTFAESEHGRSLAGSPRWSSYKPEGVSSADWIGSLGPDIDALQHHAFMYVLTDSFLDQLRSVSGSSALHFSDEEELLLRLTALSNNWAAGDPTIGDIPYERRTTEDDERERKIFGQVFEKIVGPELSIYRDDIENVLFGDRTSKIGQAWDAIESTAFVLDAFMAYDASQHTDDVVLQGHFRWMTAGALPNHTPLLQEHAKVFPPVRDFLLANEALITQIYASLEATIYERHGQREWPKVVQLRSAKEAWERRNLSEVMIKPIRVRNFEHMDTQELFDRMRRIRFRGLYDRNGDPIRPYEHAKLSLAQVFPQNTMTSPPMLIQGTREEPVWTPQPTIYEDQLSIIDTVWKALEQAGISPFDLDHAVMYDWQTWDSEPTRFAIMPPVIERQQFRLNHGGIDLRHLASLFAGTYIQDARGQLHCLADRFLRDYFIDEVSTPLHFDVFHPDLSLLNYGRHLTGERPWEFNIICDGAHRLDLATETYRRPITVILVEPQQSHRPLIPYYALPVPVLPNMRLSSKRAEALHPDLPRDKWHLLNNILKKLLHYDWSTGGLNVSSLRSQPRSK